MHLSFYSVRPLWEGTFPLSLQGRSIKEVFYACRFTVFDHWEVSNVASKDVGVIKEVFLKRQSIA